MGLLDAVLGGMMGGGQAQSSGGPGVGAHAQNPLLQIVLQLLMQNGGLQGMLGKMRQAGYGDHAQSWIGSGANLPIDASVLSQIFGQGQMQDIAEQLGMSRGEAEGQLAQALPDVVDEMTPQGQIPDGHNDLVREALAILQQRQGR